MRKMLDFLPAGVPVFIAITYLTLYLVVNRNGDGLGVGRREFTAAFIVGGVAAAVAGLRLADSKH